MYIQSTLLHELPHTPTMATDMSWVETNYKIHAYAGSSKEFCHNLNKVIGKNLGTAGKDKWMYIN